MLGHGARPGGILPTESIPRDGLRDLRRELESPGLAKALSARLLARRPANGTKDRKSTRLNSSHLGISYAVFCLKKKKKNSKRTADQHKHNQQSSKKGSAA